MINYKDYLNEKAFYEEEAGKSSAREFNEYLAEKAELMNEVNMGMFDPNSSITPNDQGTNKGAGGFTSGLLFAWLPGTSLLGAIFIAAGIAAACAGIVMLTALLIRKRRRNKLKKEITEAAEKWKKQYVEKVQIQLIDIPAESDKAKITELKKKCDALDKSMEAIEDAITKKIADTSRKGGNNDPDLYAWKQQEFGRVKQEALNEKIKLIDNKEAKEKVEEMLKDLEKELADIKEMINSGDKKGDKVSYTVNSSTTEADFRNKYEHIYKIDNWTTPNIICEMLYDDSADGLGEYLQKNNIDEQWTIATDADEIKDLPDDKKKAWYGGKYIFTMTEDEAKEKVRKDIKEIMKKAFNFTNTIESCENAEDPQDKFTKQKLGGSLAGVTMVFQAILGIMTIIASKDKKEKDRMKATEAFFEKDMIDAIARNVLFTEQGSVDFDKKSGLAAMIKIARKNKTIDYPYFVSQLKKLVSNAKSATPSGVKITGVKDVNDAIDELDEKFKAYEPDFKEFKDAREAFKADCKTIDEAKLK